jgi:hypothetical protein
MRAAMLFLALVSSGMAGEKAHFGGTWEPRPALREFWRPMRDSWWDVDKGTQSPLIARRCKEFARTHSPKTMVPEMIADLRAYPTELHWFIYLTVMLHWPQKQVLHLLDPYLHSSDPEVSHIASEFYADVESPE